MFDIYTPSQHLVFVFDALKWLFTGPVSVPVLCFGMRKLIMVMLCSHCVLCTKSVGDRVSLPSGIERALNLIIILYACSLPVVSTVFTSLIMSS